jgi:hypothetical protein
MQGTPCRQLPHTERASLALPSCRCIWDSSRYRSRFTRECLGSTDSAASSNSSASARAPDSTALKGVAIQGRTHARRSPCPKGVPRGWEAMAGGVSPHCCGCWMGSKTMGCLLPGCAVSVPHPVGAQSQALACATLTNTTSLPCCALALAIQVLHSVKVPAALLVVRVILQGLRTVAWVGTSTPR